MPSTTRAGPGLLFALLLACANATSAETQRGCVYANDNGNGVRDAGERGIAGVALGYRLQPENP